MVDVGSLVLFLLASAPSLVTSRRRCRYSGNQVSSGWLDLNLTVVKFLCLDHSGPLYKRLLYGQNCIQHNTLSIATVLQSLYLYDILTNKTRYVRQRATFRTKVLTLQRCVLGSWSSFRK